MTDAIFDRQVRLFGTETQERIGGTTVVVAGRANKISAEIVKNVVLLGVYEVRTTEEIALEAERLIKGDLETINERVKINRKLRNDSIGRMRVGHGYGIVGRLLDYFRGESKNDKSSLFYFLIDQDHSGLDVGYYFVCSGCRTAVKNSCVHQCIRKEGAGADNRMLELAKDLYVGATVVQEFIKIVDGKPETAATTFSADGL
ncbi:hypothetical protein ECANGB1_2169 [Enterospora canceri]|uniref:Uncharacterized protein n=1 Tax=Enterospora canceri TaxID=1081671 RepID=A0A1Y1S4Z2_9MICR|nr:hypothetical protein ECANGB1_2169 [Enterospora canceri]